MSTHPQPQVPASVSLPFGTFERVVSNPANATTAASLRKLQEVLGEAAWNHGSSSGGGVPAELAAARELVSTGLVAPQELVAVRGWVAGVEGGGRVLCACLLGWRRRGSWCQLGWWRLKELVAVHGRVAVVV